MNTSRLSSSTFWYRPLLVGVLSLVLTVPVLAQDRMPLTSSSETAREAVLDAIDHAFNVQPVAARAAADRALDADPEFALAMVVRGATSESYEKGQDYIDRALELTKEVSDGERMMMEAIVAQRDGDTKAFKTAVTGLAKAYPNDPNAQFMRAQLDFSERDHEASLTSLTRVTELDPEFGAAYNLLGYRAMQLEKYDKAEKAFQTYIDLRPDDANPYDSMAELYLKMGRHGDAASHYRMAYEKDNRYVGARVRAAIAMAMNNDIDAARSELKAVMDSDPEEGDLAYAYDTMADTYLYEDDVDGAIQQLDRAIEWAKSSAPQRKTYFLIQKSRMLYEAGEHEASQDVLKEAESSVAGLPEGRQDYAMSRIQIARAFNAVAQDKDADSYVTAFEEYANASGNPADGELLHELKAVRAFQAGDMETAMKHIKQAGEQPYAHYYHGLMLRETGDASGALAYFRKAANANEPSRSFALIRNKARSELDR